VNTSSILSGPGRVETAEGVLPPLARTVDVSEQNGTRIKRKERTYWEKERLIHSDQLVRVIFLSG
jgi:hypothetical protein